MSSQQPERSSEHVAETQPAQRPKLVFVYSERSGPSRRAEGFLAQVLQRRHNHETFHLVRVNADSQPQLAQHLGVTALPTLLVVEARKIRARVEVPKGRGEIETALGPWLR
jgi:thioredoxin-like negative regulator of GroEL